MRIYEWESKSQRLCRDSIRRFVDSGKFVYSDRSKGFTLLEILMSIALITVVAGIGVPVYQSFQVKNDLDVAVNSWAQALIRAQALSRATDGDSTWGAGIQSGNLTLFKGTSFALRDTAYDEVFDIAGSITPSGLTEIVFAKFSGLPQSTGTTTLTSSTNEVRAIAINSKGMVSY